MTTLSVGAASYDMAVLNAMMEIEEKFQEMVCEAYGVEDEEDLPKEVQDIDVVKFAELPPSTIASIVTNVLGIKLTAGSSGKIKLIIDSVILAVEAAKEKNAAVWPGHPDSKKSMKFDATAEEKASAQKFMTGKYNFKVMRRLTAIENKFLDALTGYYGVEDEDDLPAEIQEISLGEMFEEEKSSDEIRAKIGQQLSLRPWEGMDQAAMDSVIDEVMDVLSSLIDSAKTEDQDS